ncbi:MAG: Rhomboid family protein [Oscillospiraceae bacterium]|nr:Rhomboid family protein [Oscillospiraceae bacterium]
MEKWLDRMERKYYRFGIPNLTKYLVIGQIIVWAVMMLVNQNIYSYLMLDKSAILHGQLWRLFTFIFVPPAATIDPLDLFTIALNLYFLYFVGMALENAWGKFRTTAFLLAGMVGCWAACLLVPSVLGASFLNGILATSALMSSFTLAFACVYPDAPLMLFFAIPMPAKYLGIIEGLLLGRSFLQIGMLGPRLSMLLGLAGFWCFVGPKLWNKYQAHKRRRQWQDQWRR